MCSWSHAHWQKVDFLSEYMCFLSAVVSNQLALTKRIAGWACKAFSLVNAIGKGTNGLVLRSLVGAALIKKYSSYRTYPKKIHVFFFQNWFAGTWNHPPTGGRRFSPPRQFYPSPSRPTSPNIPPPGIECVTLVPHARNSGSTVVGGQHFPMPLWSQNRDSFFPRGKNYATPSKIQ
jgi:hypothetical protein